MNDQRRLVLALGAATALVAVIAGGWFWTASGKAHVTDLHALDDIEEAPLLAKGDRLPMSVASRKSDAQVVASAGPFAAKPLPQIRGLSVFRPAVIDHGPGVSSYADPNAPTGVPFEVLTGEDDGSIEPPEDLPSVEDQAHDAAVEPLPMPRIRPNVAYAPDLPLPRVKPAMPKPLDSIAGHAPAEPLPTPSARPRLEVPQLETRVASLASTGDDGGESSRGSSLFQRGQEKRPSAFRAAMTPRDDSEAPPGVRVPNGTQMAALPPQDKTDDGARPNVILKTPFGVPYTLQTESVEMSCAPPPLLSLLRAFEKRYGQKVVITSGYRSRGRSGSLHRRCLAADIIVPGVPADDLAKYARTIPGMGGIGHYCHPNMIHVDVGTPREWKYGCGSYFVARDGSDGKWGKVPGEAQPD
ncbi:MAG: DUF882 domain-containing protein [Hyphomicrobiaceae bacterium]|nr:DUF882 domain-containing protein [Hyphomicrobiaceae bacterium]